MNFNPNNPALFIASTVACLSLISCGGSGSIIDAVALSPAANPTTSADSTVPVVTITKNTTAAATGTATLEGRASDNKKVARVTWANDRGGRGSATLASTAAETTWSTPPIQLQIGNNTITVTAVDAAGNHTAATTVINAPTAAAPSAGTAVNSAGMAVKFDAAKIPTGSKGVAGEQIKATAEKPAPIGTEGAFRTVCDFSHMASDDPIVYPGQPGRSHLHAFFGNTGTSANSTAESLATTGNSTCRGGIVNRTAYWVPAMIDTLNGAPVKPSASSFYYKTGYGGIPVKNIQAFPAGLRMIAGDPMNSGPKGPFRFKCVGGGAEALVGSSIQNCPAGAALWQEIFFPQCWDGVNLDSPDHKSHMAYPSGGACPATHPIALPDITFNIIYNVAEANAPLRWRLASDGYDASLPAGYSSHGDWFNGWKSDIMAAFVKNCDQAAADCHAHLLGDGREIY